MTEYNFELCQERHAVIERALQKLIECDEKRREEIKQVKNRFTVLVTMLAMNFLMGCFLIAQNYFKSG